MFSKHHDSIRTGLNWKELRKLRMTILVDQNFLCAGCQRDVIENDIRFDLHHTNNDPQDNDLGNLAVVCEMCHYHLHKRM